MKVTIIMILATVAATTQADLADRLPKGLDYTTVRGLVVQHDGRWMPLDTLAKDMATTVLGRGHDRRLDVGLLLAWTFDPEHWTAELQKAYTTGNTKSRDRLQDLLEGEAIRLVPDPTDALGPWRPVSAISEREGPTQAETVRAWAQLQRAFLNSDGPGFSSASKQLASALARLPAAHRPDPTVIKTELFYNRLNVFGLSCAAMLAATALTGAGLAIRRRWFDAVTSAGLVLALGVLTYGLVLRWRIAGHIPASNMFESLLFMSWGAVVVAVIAMTISRNRLAAITASGLGAAAMTLAVALPIDSFIRPIAPVLRDTVWMSIHVPVIMVSYSMLALAVVIAHVQIAAMAVAPGRRTFVDRIDSLHLGYVRIGTFLLLLGIVTGSMWGAASWGRYWGWDPKEVWSLAALLGYLGVLHGRLAGKRIGIGEAVLTLGLTAFVLAVLAVKLAPMTAGKLAALAGSGLATAVFVFGRSRFATAVKSVLAFWLIVMTYVGVNYVLGIGLHSYAFGTGSVAGYMFRIGGLDLLLVGICGVIYYSRPAVPGADGFAPGDSPGP